MFSLIVTIISIALVAALALATLYYGGDIFNQGADRAQAAKVAAQGQQVMGALELYHAEHGVYPNTLADLVTTEYLKSIPVAFAPEVAAVQAALAAGVTWTLAAPGQPVIALTPVSLATCKAYNAAQFGIAQVLRAPHEAQLKSCYGASESTLTIIQAKSSSDLVFVSNNAAAPLQIGPVVATPLPAAASTDTSIDGWLLPGAAGTPAVTFLDNKYETPVAVLAVDAIPVGTTSHAYPVTVQNTGTAALTFNAISATASAPFAISDNTCTGSLAPNATCYVSVTFSPAAVQDYTGGSYVLQLSASNLAIAGLPVSGSGLVAAAPTTLVMEVALSLVAAQDQLYPNLRTTFTSKNGVDLSNLKVLPDSMIYFGTFTTNSFSNGDFWNEQWDRLQGPTFAWENQVWGGTPVNPYSLSELLAGQTSVEIWNRQDYGQVQTPFMAQLPVGSNPGLWCVTVDLADKIANGGGAPLVGVAVEGACP